MGKLIALLAAALAAGGVPADEGGWWVSRRDAPRVVEGGGTRVTLSSRRCRADEMGSDACYFGKGVFNAAQLAIERAGLPTAHLEVNEVGAAYRIAVVRLRPRDRAPSILVESDPGGSGGGNVFTVFLPEARGFRRLKLSYPAGGGGAAVFPRPSHWPPRDRDGDGRIDVVIGDPLFGGSPWGCHACEVLPPRMYAFADDGTVVDESRSPALRPMFARQFAETRRACRSRDPDTSADERHPACAAYLADAARLGRFDAAWREVAALPAGRTHGQGGRDFLASVRAVLRSGGYVR